MNLRGQIGGQGGYAMAVLLVSLSVMAILLTVAMPVWKHTARRERETELVFRGQQYARAIGLFQRKHGPGTLPPTIDVLVNEHFLRKKFKDPITNDDFQVLVQGAQQPGIGQQQPGSARPGTQVSGRGAPTSAIMAGPPTTQVQGRGGVIGVASKSTAESIRIYNGRTHY